MASDPTSPAPTFGRPMLAHWALDPKITYLNHGTVGAPPRRVLAAQQAVRDEVELQPSRFLLRDLAGHVGASPPAVPLIREAAGKVAAFVGARPDDVAFVDNATTGANAVLRSLELAEGDEILVLDHTYGAVVNAAAYVARRQGARVVTAELPCPVRDPGEVVAALAAAITPRTRLAIVDHITAESALILPVAEIAALCRARGVAVMVDGAHAPGALALDLPALGVDWYTANLHKWAWSPRSCGFLWAPPERQQDLHPTVISWGLDQGFAAEFDWVGTRDPSPFLAAPAGIDFLEELGAAAVRDYDHALAWEGAKYLAAAWKTDFGTPEAMIGTMATVPLPQGFGSTRPEAMVLRDALLYEDKIEVQLHAFRERLWIRISAQIYNEMADIERLARAVLARA
jgi:isopenicillin-N epimerase